MAAVLPSESLKPEIKLTTAEKRAVFDWSPERRRGVIDNSKTILTDFLAMERYGEAPIDKAIVITVDNLWSNVIGCFQGNGNNTPLLVINNQLITPFKPNILPTHSEYHVSKVLTLSTQLFDIAPQELKTRGNALAISLATIIHDTGSLLQGDETGPQEKMYKFHELRAIALVDKVVDALYRNDKGDHQQLKNKIKMLIASTIPKWNLDFSSVPKTTISKLLDPNYVPPITLDDMMTDLFLNPDASDDGETVKMKKQLRGQANELFSTFDTLRRSSDEKAIREMSQLTHLMGAADHGAYMLEPSNIAEVFGLWQEQQTEWEGVDGKLTHRNFSFNAETSYKWFTSPFTDTQWGEFGSLIRELGVNPFAPDLSINRSKDIADHVRSILRENKSPQDALSRVEGAFSPVELDNLAHKLGLENSKDIKDAIITFSHKFAHRFAEPHNFDALSTDVLKLMYDRVSDKSAFLKEVLEAIIDDSVNELTPDGTINVHIAPFAYADDAGVFYKQITDAYELIDPLKRQRIKSIIFTIREGSDTIDSIRGIASRFQTTDKPVFGFALGGNPISSELITDLLKAEGNSIDMVIHFGLENTYEIMEQRLNTLLNHIRNVGRPDVLLSHLSIHIDDGYEHFNRYVNNHDVDKELLETLIKSVSPLGYLLTRGQKGFDHYQEFAKNFKGAVPGSNNASMKAGYRVAIEDMVIKLMNE